MNGIEMFLRRVILVSYHSRRLSTKRFTINELKEGVNCNVVYGEIVNRCEDQLNVFKKMEKLVEHNKSFTSFHIIERNMSILKSLYNNTSKSFNIENMNKIFNNNELIDSTKKRLIADMISSHDSRHYNTIDNLAEITSILFHNNNNSSNDHILTKEYKLQWLNDILQSMRIHVKLSLLLSHLVSLIIYSSL
jgi:hypothetical protein